MLYLFTLIEGVLSFLSPCVLPLLPVYAAYFAAGRGEDGAGAWKNPLGFFIGLVASFVALGALAGAMGARIPARPLELFSGGMLLLFGLHYLGALRVPFLMRMHGGGAARVGQLNFFRSVLFGIVFALAWTPCVGPFLGAAMMKAALAGTILEGILLLLVFGVGFGLPFFISALLLDHLKGIFAFIKRHYRAINGISGALLILMGALMITGVFGRVMQQIVR